MRLEGVVAPSHRNMHKPVGSSASGSPSEQNRGEGMMNHGHKSSGSAGAGEKRYPHSEATTTAWPGTRAPRARRRRRSKGRPTNPQNALRPLRLQRVYSEELHSPKWDSPTLAALNCKPILCSLSRNTTTPVPHVNHSSRHILFSSFPVGQTQAEILSVPPLMAPS